jgi:type IV fimbrial biogenesis protein FimT
MPTKTRSLAGFSLLEMIIAMTIAGILAAIAIPSFSVVVSNNRLTAYANQFITAINLARSEAIKRGAKVTIKHLGNTPKDWKGGWQVFVDIDGQPTNNKIGQYLTDEDGNNCEVDAVGAPIEDCLLRIFPALPEGFTFWSKDSFKETIIYNAIGKSVSNTGLPINGTLIMCDGNRAAEEQKISAKPIIISSTGRARIGVDNADADSIPNLTESSNIDGCIP